MNNTPFEPNTEAVAREIANSSIGFCLLRTSGPAEDALAAGSGTLVRYGNIAGILTAGHVLRKGRVQKRHLPEYGQVGLVRFPNQQGKLQKYKLEMGYTDRIVVWSGEESNDGPDIGFLRLPLPVVADLEATNTFLNLRKRYQIVTADEQPGPPWFHAVVGSVGEWVSDLPTRKPSTRLKGFHLLFGDGNVSRKETNGGFGTLRFVVSFSDQVAPPSSYAGVSGGGLWCVYFEEGPDCQTLIRERRLIGVAFFEEQSGSEIQIICHGPLSVYSRLREKIWAKWPDEV